MFNKINYIMIALSYVLEHPFATWHASIHNEVTGVVCHKGTSISDKDRHFAQPCTDLRQGLYTVVTRLGLDIGLCSVLLLKDVFQHLRMLLLLLTVRVALLTE